MKKFAMLFTTLLLVVLMAVPVSAASFTPSVEQKEEPTLSTMTDASGNEVVAIIRDADGNEIQGVTASDLVITPVSKAGEADAAISEMLTAAYEQIKGANTLADLVPTIGDTLTALGSKAAVEDLVVRDVFDVTVTGAAAEYLAEEGNTITFRFDLGISPSALLLVLHNYSGSDWEIIADDKVVKNADGTVDVTFESLSPIAFVVDGKETTDGDSVDANAPTSPQTNDNTLPPVVGAGILGLGCAAVLSAVVIWKKRAQN